MKTNTKYSGYRLMWMIVMFDLPTVDADDKKKASTFRKFLLNNGFEMSQFSVYLKFIGLRENSNKVIKQVKTAVPPGRVSMLFFTDKQFSEIISINNNVVERNPEAPEQLLLF